VTDASLNPASLRGAVDLSSLVRAAQQPKGEPASAAAAAQGGGRAAAGGDAVSATVVSEADDQSFGAAVELSRTVPVIVEFYGGGIEPFLPTIVKSFGGRLVLVTVDGNRSPQVAQAFQITQVPAVVALIGGRPVPLFVGLAAEDEVRQVFEQVLELASQNGVTGSANPPAGVEDDAQPVEEPLPPLHQEAYDAVAQGDLDAAITAFETAIAQNPRDDDAVAGLAQVALLKRLSGTDAGEIRRRAAEHPDDADAQLAIADLDVSGGHVEDAFARLLTVFPRLDADGKAAVRTRMLDYFQLVGADDPRVVTARRQLTNLLY
jgi:putative thioredoxin